MRSSVSETPRAGRSGRSGREVREHEDLPSGLVRVLAQIREVDDRAADQDLGRLERALSGGYESEDVGVAAQLDGRHAGFPVEDLEVPGAAREPTSVGIKLSTLRHGEQHRQLD